MNLMRVTFTVCYPIPIHRIELSTGRDHDGLLCVVNCRYLRYSSNNSLFFIASLPYCLRSRPTYLNVVRQLVSSFTLFEKAL